MPPIRAIFFDMGDTILNEYPTGEEVIQQAAAEVAGIEFDVTDYAGRYDLLRAALADIDYSLASNRSFWTRLGVHMFSDAAGRPVSEEVSREVWRRFDAILHESKRTSLCPRKYVDYLQELHERGYILGVISNWNDSLFRVCERYHLGHLLSFALASEMVGVSKPHPEIFLRAVEMSGVPKDETIFIGDNFHYDCAGAMRAGLRAIHLNVGIIHQAALVVQLLRRGIRSHILPGKTVPKINTILDLEPHLVEEAAVGG